jgi:hypothetical protein
MSLITLLGSRKFCVATELWQVLEILVNSVRLCAVGGVAEWLKAHAWKACMRATVSRVRIPLPPPIILTKYMIL